MKNIRHLLKELAAQESDLPGKQFLAPAVQGGRVRLRMSGIIYTFEIEPRGFEGWGIFKATAPGKAQLMEPAAFLQIAQYLEQFPQARLWLTYPLRGQTWLAYPMNESDWRQRTGTVKPVVVHLVGEGGKFEPVVVRWDGKNGWFEACDRRADPLPTEQLRTELKRLTHPKNLSFKGLTPEMRTVYEQVATKMAEFNTNWQHYQDEKRLQAALKMGGGELQSFQESGDEYWTVHWTTRTGEQHTSAICKQDLTVFSSGICLSGRDRDFDLQSLIGVIENQDEWFD
ncbi:hypothetical protein [Laspinema olomoucense]|uniref:hypothetical protein n=1 Tax=Laspinema olomoucense TaxID=3231600 RepID=UPI0021BA4494|nr:hypothetical protein [Laspinema sp. D3c]MCT7997381.1 hypothetical protein [Laspinema sp. D3c]